MLDTKGKWTKKFPSSADKGKWFFMKTETPDSSNPIFRKSIHFIEVRVDKDNGRNGRVYFARESSDPRGILVTSFGTPMINYAQMARLGQVEFYGPIQTPPNYRT